MVNFYGHIIGLDIISNVRVVFVFVAKINFNTNSRKKLWSTSKFGGVCGYNWYMISDIQIVSMFATQIKLNATPTKRKKKFWSTSKFGAESRDYLDIISQLYPCSHTQIKLNATPTKRKKLWSTSKFGAESGDYLDIISQLYPCSPPKLS